VSEVSPWVVSLLVLVAVAVAFLIIFRRRRPPVQEDPYSKGLEKWLAGDLPAARDALRRAIDADPGSIDPYLQLGNLLRLMGDAKRATVLHRGLTVRGDIPEKKRISITLCLADDLLALARWTEAKEVLDSLRDMAADSPRYWRARFAQWFGVGDEGNAALALQTAGRLCREPDAGEFRQQFEFFQADRAVRSARAGQVKEARRFLKDVRDGGPAAAKGKYVQALWAVEAGDMEKAVAAGCEGLLDSPLEISLFLRPLQMALLESGHHARTVPILERACQAETSPPALWITLAQLYDKLDRREDALALLAAKSGDAGLNPDTAAPFLNLLAGEVPTSDLGRVWSYLHQPATVPQGWRCQACGTGEDEVRWYCPACGQFDTFVPEPIQEEMV